jgi:hypothetical protein
MKLSLVIVFALSIALCAPAQTLVSKDGQPVLPQKGDKSLGFDMTRLLRLQNFALIPATHAISAKYMRDSVSAYRVGIRLGINSWTTRNRVENRAAAATTTASAHPAALPMNDNVWIRSGFSSGVSFGIEKRRGASRLQAIYGIEAGVYMSTSTDKFTYATTLNASPTTPIDVDSSDAMSSAVLGHANNINSDPPIVGIKGAARVVERSNGMSITVGTRGFAGAEYFFLPKISLGAELGWGIAFTTTGRSEITYESIGTGTGGNAVRRSTVDGSVNTHFSADSDSFNGISGGSAVLRLNIYF